MFSQLSFTYRQKFYLIIIGGILVFAALYKKTYRNIFDIHGELDLTKEMIISPEKIYSEIGSVRAEIRSIDDILGGGAPDESSEQTRIFKFITASGLPVDITRIRDEHVFHEVDYTVYTNEVELEGDYEQLISLLYRMELNFNSSRVMSAKFYTLEDYISDKISLRLIINLQNYAKE